MAENLCTIHYRNREIIPEVTDNNAWNALTSGAYCNYKNTRNKDNIAILGRLYNFYAAYDTRNLAPKGWHIPSQTEWQTLITYLGGSDVAGNKLKETFTIHWNSPSAGTNESGFTALPGGWRNALYQFFQMGKTAGWWSNTKDAVNTGFCETLYNSLSSVDSLSATFDNGFSIRCIKD